MSELGVLDDENCIRGLMRNLEKRQAQEPLGDQSGKAERRKAVKNKEIIAFKVLWQQETLNYEKNGQNSHLNVIPKSH